MYLLKIVMLTLLPLQKGYQNHRPQILSEVKVENRLCATKGKYTNSRMVDDYPSTGANNPTHWCQKIPGVCGRIWKKCSFSTFLTN